MSVNQTKLAGVLGTSLTDHYLADADAGPGSGSWTLGLFLQCVALVSDVENEEVVFSTASGNTGVSVARGSESSFNARIGNGGAVQLLQCDLYTASVAGTGLFLHFTYDSETLAFAWYRNGAFADSITLDDPFAPGVPARIGAALLNNTTNNSTVVLAAGIANAKLTGVELENEVCRSMFAHDLVPNNYVHLWSVQADSGRELPATLNDYGSLANIPMSRVGLGGTSRWLSDVQFSSPVANLG